MWSKCKDKKNPSGQWCDFWKLNTDSITAKLGVYVIWADIGFLYTLYVGKGEIAKRIEAHRGEEDFISCRDDGEKMFVTWHPFPEKELKGRERYLADLLEPDIGERHPKKERPIKTDPPPPLK